MAQDERLSNRFGQTNAWFRGERMIRGQHGNEWIGPELLCA